MHINNSLNLQHFMTTNKISAVQFTFRRSRKKYGRRNRLQETIYSTSQVKGTTMKRFDQTILSTESESYLVES